MIEVTPRFGQMIGCDFDGRSRAAVLLRSSNGELVASIDGELRPVPEAWTNHACMIRWADDSRVFVWPIALHAEPHVGVIGSGGVSTMNVGLPLDMFGGKGLLVCTYAEDQITGPVEEADLIATFEIPSFRKISRFVEPLLANFRGVFFAEVEHGVLDQELGDFWFVAYETPFLWRYSPSSQRIAVANLGSPLESIRAITCSDRKATVVCQDEAGLYLRSYKGAESSVCFDGQISWTGEEARRFAEGLLRHKGQLAGYHGNRIALVTSMSAGLTTLPI